MERRQFTREFKLEAVRLIKQRGVSYAQASKDLGVHPTQLRNWVATKNPHLHPTLMRRVGDALAGALAVIWGSIGVVVVAAIFG